MASVAAIYTVASWVRTPEQILPEQKPQHVVIRPRPEQKRVWASLERSPEEVIQAMFEEAAHRDPNREKQWVARVDGNETQIQLLAQLAQERKLDVAILVDFIHVAEYVWEAAKALLPDDPTQQDHWVRDHLAGDPAREGQQSGRRDPTKCHIPRNVGRKAQTCGRLCRLSAHKYAGYLQYEEALKRGVPIATGVIEGACGYLVEARMNRSGARWSLTSAEAVLRLRALRASGDFDKYWEFHEQQEYQRNHAAKYADQHVPDVVTPAVSPSKTKRRAGLKIVK
jgi:hypothetical protein